MEFWDTFWATMWGALAGAVVGAAAAWAFALDLRRRATLDRDRQEARDYADRIRLEWPKVFKDLQDYGNASRAVYDAERTDQNYGDRYEVYRQANMQFIQRVVEVATVARGDDYSIVNHLGVLQSVSSPHTEHHIRSIDKATNALLTYSTSPQEDMEAAKTRLVGTLQSLVEDSIEAEEGDDEEEAFRTKANIVS